MKIGVFDSGVGGLSVARAIERAMPQYEVLFVNDKANVPYGLKTPDELLQLVTPIMQRMIDDGCAVIVVACNTVSTTLIGELRDRFSVPFVAMEPMVKPAAALTKSKVIAVCATPATLQSRRYAWLKETYASDCTVLEPDCGQWALWIEENQVDSRQLAATVDSLIDQGADVIVLGCTHYHWIEADIRELAAKKAVVLQPEQAVVAQLRRVLTSH